MRATMCFMVFVIGAISYADVPVKPSRNQQAEAALSLAAARRQADKHKLLPLLAAEAQARYSGLPLVLWIKVQPPEKLDPMPPAIHTVTSTWNGDGSARVVVISGDRAFSLPKSEVDPDPVAAIQLIVSHMK